MFSLIFFELYMHSIDIDISIYTWYQAAWLDICMPLHTQYQLQDIFPLGS